MFEVIDIVAVILIVAVIIIELISIGKGSALGYYIGIVLTVVVGIIEMEDILSV